MANVLAGNGISVSASQPLWAGAATIYSGLESRLTTLDTEKSAMGGWRSARLGFQLRPHEVADWLENGLGRHVDIHSHTLSKNFECFVDTITVDIGGSQITVGPLMQIINELAVAYQTITYDTNPPTGGNRARLAFLAEATSQARYGVLQGVLSGGTGTQTEMEQIQARYLLERSRPSTGRSLSLDVGATPTITLECLGYVAYLGKYYYQDVVNYSTTTLAEKVASVLAADPNGLFSARLSANALTIGEYADEDQTAASVIQDVVVRGDSNYDRWLFGVYEGRTAVYERASQSIDYVVHATDSGRWIEDTVGNRVYPWDVMPGKWIFEEDMIPVVPPKGDFREDIRATFIETVSYSAPWSLSISGGKTDRLAQKMAQLGLGGAGV